MNPEVKEKWIKALESGEYTQGMGYLKSELKGEYFFCCLGVLCDIHANETGNEWDKNDALCLDNIYSYLGEKSFLPQGLTHWANLDPDDISYLVNRNDDGSTFDEISQYIRNNLRNN